MEDNRDKTYLDEDDEIVTLTYDNGEKEDFYLIAELDYAEKWYAYLVPVEPDEEFEDDEVLVYEIASDEDGNECFLPVEDDDLVVKLVDMLNDELGEEE